MPATITSSPRNLWQKLAEVSGKLGAIAKDGEAPAAMGGFKFISHGAVMGHLRQQLAERHVAVLESLELISDESVTMHTKNGERQGRRVVVKLTCEFVNGENPEERHSVSWFGEGLDLTDKALQKAATSAQKYVLMKTFLVSDKDDPDGAEAPGEMTGSGHARAAAPPPARSAPEVPTGEEVAALIRLAGVLPRPIDVNWIDEQLAKYSYDQVRRALLVAHDKQCGAGCAHVTEQTSLVPS